MIVPLKIHLYEAEDCSTVVVPTEDELHEAFFRARWHHKRQRSQNSETERAHEAHMRHLERFAADCAVLRPLSQVWKIDLDIPTWKTINEAVEEVPLEWRTVDRVTSALLPVFMGRSLEQINEVPVPVLIKVKQEIWNYIRPIEPDSTEHHCQLDYLFGGNNQ